jgi:hypothetical protein
MKLPAQPEPQRRRIDRQCRIEAELGRLGIRKVI